MSRAGIVTRVHAGRVCVVIGGHEVSARLRGSLKVGPRTLVHLIAVGDRVRIGGPGDAPVVEEVLPRTNRIARVDPGDRSQRRAQILAANLDQLLVVATMREPTLNLRALDRLLVLGEASAVRIAIVLNKIDLLSGEAELPPVYAAIGYPVYAVSAVTGDGIPRLARALLGMVSLFAGPSGVGKSSLVNALAPGPPARVARLSSSTGKGVHTTTHVSWNALAGGGAVLDAPGIRSIQPSGIDATTLPGCFPEFRSLGPCQFSDCRHLAEPGCAILEGVKSGVICETRHGSYARILETLAGRPRG